MDFRINQNYGTAFGYVLTFNSKHALVEYTLFSGELLEQGKYEDGLKSYIKDFLNIESYTFLEIEFGVFPMTNHVF